MIGDLKSDRKIFCADQVTTPPGILPIIDSHTFHNNQKIQVDRGDGIASLLGCKPPIFGWVIAPPTGIERFITQIYPNDRIISFITICQHLPIIDPTTLWIAAGVPESI